MWIAIGILVVLLAVLAVAVATRPDTFRVERSATIAAPADMLFGYVNDFHQWNLWSPWEKLDPNMMRTFSGAQSGVTSTYTWSGNSKAGEGSMAITESVPSQRIALDLNFVRPFKSSNVIVFAFAPIASATQVTWTMTGRNNTMTKLMSLVTSMDKLVGKDFEQGLSNLKALAEAEAKRRAG
jgi:hypothetical protein